MQPAFRAAALALALAFAGPAARAGTDFGNHSIVGSLCVGLSCAASESFGPSETLKLKHESLSILFDDISTGSGYPNEDWLIRANDAAPLGASYFALEDVDGAGAVFKVEDGARANALYLAAGGHAGLGTALPGATLHMVSGAAPALRLDQDGSGGNTPRTWQIAGDHAGLRLSDLTAATQPLTVLPGAPGDALVLDGSGRLGLGTAAPGAGLHMARADGAARLRIVETATPTGPRNLLELLNNGRPEIVMGNTFTNGEWSFGAGTNFILKQGAVGSDSSVKTKLFEIDPAGNAILTGALTTGGPSCATGCDAVLAPGYKLPSIAEHAAAMFALGHLPNVGPTGPDRAVNLTDQMGRILNELEHAHIYIARLETELRRLPRLEAENAALAARLARLERALAGAD